MMPKVSFVAIGDELTTGAISDKNCAFLAGELTALGFEVLGITIVRDRLSEIVAAVSAEAQRADLIITTGGLGPTSDDMTREALAQLCGVEVYENDATVLKIRKRYEARNIPFNVASLRQALFPCGSVIIENPAGTADCFQVQVPAHSRTVPAMALPGIPSEVTAIYHEKLTPLIRELFPDRASFPVATLRCFGLSESHIGTVIDEALLPSSVRVAYRPLFPEVLLKFTEESFSTKLLQESVARVKQAVGEEFFIGKDTSESLADIVGKLLESRKKTVAFAESCTAGLATSTLVARAGASQFFPGSVVTYSNDAKERLLGVSAKSLEQFGAVSEQVAKEMAEGVRRKFESSFGVSITGIAGPEGGSEVKPVGTVWFAIADDVSTSATKFHIPFERNRFRHYGAHLAVDLLRRKLLGFPISWERR